MLMRNVAEKIYWSKVILGVTVAFLCITFNLTDFYGLGFGIGLYFASALVYRYILNIWSNKIFSLRRLYMIGVGAYFFTWIVLWSTIYSVLYFM